MIYCENEQQRQLDEIRDRQTIEMMSDDEFWASENAIVRSQVLQNPAIMASLLENLQQRASHIEKTLDDLMEQVQWLIRNK